MFLLNLFLLALTLSSSLGHIYYVKPNSSSVAPANCPGHTCLTLDQYAAEQHQYFTTNSTFLFLTGNHSTRTAVHIRNASNITLRGIGTDPAMYMVNMTLYCEDVSHLSVQNMTLTLTGGTGENGTAVSVVNSNSVTFLHVSWQATVRALLFNHSSATIDWCVFQHNYGDYGGAVHISNHSNITLNVATLADNGANSTGGAIYANQSQLWVNETKFTGNYAGHEAGGIHCERSNCIMVAVNFISNKGEAMYYHFANVKCTDCALIRNTRTAIYTIGTNLTFVGNTTMIENKGLKPAYPGALMATTSSVTFTGNTLFKDNHAKLEGGAVKLVLGTKLKLSGVTIFSNNSAKLGGAILASINVKMEMTGNVTFINNKCTVGSGGAIFALRNSRIIVADRVSFESNWAVYGGAIILRDSTITLKRHAIISTYRNYAKKFGGAIFHKDKISSIQCNFSLSSLDKQDIYLLHKTPKCFLQLENFKFSNANASKYKIISQYDSAGSYGQFLYGGLMDRCYVLDSHNDDKIQYDLLYFTLFKYHFLQIQSDLSDERLAISSMAYSMCICANGKYNCDRPKINIIVIRGQKFELSVVAVAQGSTTRDARITAKVKETARLELSQYSQHTAPNCTTLHYNMYSTKDNETMRLYPVAPCQDTGQALVLVNVIFLPCPVAFTKSGDRCICDQRLQKHNVTCIVGDDRNTITRWQGSRFWMGYVNESSQEGLILYSTCPIDYCKTTNTSFSLEELDEQCAYNHSGLLCGACATNHSLIFHNLKCKKCSSRFLGLLVVFAAAGILLVGFLSLLRLTVATGLINSIILYANIVQANKILFFHSNPQNVLTVFIAWMNLDLGLPTCFYDGMDAYAHTWLQFAFPLYVWVLISVIILTSRYSTVMTRLLGSNPVAVLATLLLMSYAKILKTIISIYSSVQLEYPNGTVTMWLKDANVPYLQSKHLVLAVVGSVFVAFIFFPYTIFLLLGYKLYLYKTKCIRALMIKMKPLLDSYYAPYERHTRYWTGLLLLVRCALYIVFSFNSIGGTDRSFIAIIITFTALIIVAWLSGKIYRKFCVNVVEALVYLNLISLSAVTFNRDAPPLVVHSLVGFVFLTMVGIICYHFYLTYVVRSRVWSRIISRLSEKRKKLERHGCSRKNTPDCLAIYWTCHVIRSKSARATD